MRPIGFVFALSLVLAPLAAPAQVHVSSEERFFRIEWQVERAEGRDAAILGVLRNHYFYWLQRVQLQVQILDEAGQVSQDAFAAIDDIPPGGRGSFRLELPRAGARYAVYAFEFGAREGP